MTGKARRLGNRTRPGWGAPLLTVCVIASAIMAAALSACLGEDTPITIGFSGQLTGPFSDLGVQGRNGATLAVEKINAAGGVAGRDLKLIPRDDANTPEGALAADRALLDAGVVAIIGHMTSGQTMAALDALAARGALLVSPTTATPVLTGKKDLFFRVIPDNRSWARNLARHAVGQLGLTSLALLGDVDNVAYTDTFLGGFRDSFTGMGGHVATQIGFSSRGLPDWQALVASVRASGAQGVVLCASSRDVASFAQTMAASGERLPVLCPTWPYTREILQVGGKSVNGILFATSYTEQNDYPAFRAFRQDYENRFGWPANFAAAYAYEAVMVLAEALKRTGGVRAGLEDALAGLDMPGVIGPLHLDQYGDVERDTFIVTIADGRFQTVATVGR